MSEKRSEVDERLWTTIPGRKAGDDHSESGNATRKHRTEVDPNEAVGSIRRESESVSRGEDPSSHAEQSRKVEPETKRQDTPVRRHHNFLVCGKRLRLVTISCLLFTDKNPLRKLFVTIVFWNHTELIIHLMILVNALFLGLYNYTKGNSETRFNGACTYVLLAFRVLFIAEAGVKSIAQGFIFAQRTYLRDPWNCVDFAIVISIPFYFGSTTNFTIFRLLRLLRVIQLLNVSETMRFIVSTLLKSLPQVAFIFCLLMTALLIFSVVGISSFRGATHYFCRTTPGPVNNTWEIAQDDRNMCGGYHACSPNYTCGSLYASLGLKDNSSVELYYGVTHFDSIGHAFVTCAQGTVIEGWSKIMYSLGDAFSLWYSGVYFVLCVLFCGYFIVALILPVLQDYYFNYMLYVGQDSSRKTIKFQKKLTSLFRDPVDDSPFRGNRTLRSLRKSLFESLSLSGSKFGNVSTDSCRGMLVLILDAPIFNSIIALMILINDGIMASDTLGYSNKSLLSVSYFLFLSVFTVEAALRIIADTSYLCELHNVIDLLIILGSVVECLVFMDRGCLLALRTFKVFLYIKLTQSVQHTVRVVAKAVQNLLLLSLIALIFLYIFAVLGMQFFAGRLNYFAGASVDLTRGGVPRANYNTLLQALFTCFQGFMTDGWFDHTYLAIQEVGWKYSLFFYPLLLTGNVIFTSMFYAILLSIFKEKKVSVEETNRRRRSTKMVLEFMSPSRASVPNFPRLALERKSLKILPTFQMPAEEDPEKGGSSIPGEEQKEELQMPTPTEQRLHSEDNGEQEVARVLECISEESSGDNEATSALCAYLKSSSLFVFHRDWAVRKWLAEWVVPFDEECYFLEGEYLEDIEINDAISHMNTRTGARESFQKILQSEYLAFRKTRANIFDFIILVLIVLSIVALILDDPLADVDSTLKIFCWYCHLVFTIAFTLEALLKIVAMGLICSSRPKEDAYLQSGWNILDLFVVITSIISISSPGHTMLKSLKALRALRILRPVKSMNGNEQLKLLITSIITVTPSIAKLIVFTSFYLFSIGLITTFYLKGKLYNCSLQAASITTRQECESAGGTWDKIHEGFDNVGWSMLTLLQMGFREGWTLTAYNMIDARGIDLVPEREYNPAWGLFATCYLLITNLMLTGMFLCVLFECFYTAKLEFCGALSCDLNEQQWINIQRFMVRRDLKIHMAPPTNRIRAKCFELAQGVCLEVVDTVFNCLGILMYSLKTYRMNEELELILDIFIYISVSYLNAGVGVKLLGYGKAFFQENWRKWELFSCVMSDVGFVLKLAGVTPIVLAAGTAFRLGMVLRQLRKIPNSKVAVIADSIAFILPSLLNVVLMVALLVLIYAILGVELFWQVKYQGNNFRSFWGAVLLVFSCGTGDRWNDVMHSLLHVEGTCVDSQTYEGIQTDGIMGCGTFAAYPYFISLVLVIYLIGTKLFTIVVIEGYMEAVNENFSLITANQFETFLEKWAVFDPAGTGWISFEDMIYLFFSLDPPLGVYTLKAKEYLWNSFIEMNRRQKKIVLRSTLRRRLISQVELNEEIFMHKHENVVIQRTKIFQLLKELKIPLEVNTWRVHFRDICQRMAVRAIMKNKNENFEIHEKKALLFFKQKWMAKFPEKRKRGYQGEVYGQDYWAAHLVTRILKQRVARIKERNERRAYLFEHMH